MQSLQINREDPKIYQQLQKKKKITSTYVRRISKYIKSIYTKKYINTLKNIFNTLKIYIKCKKDKIAGSDRFEGDKKRSNLQKNDEEFIFVKEDFKGFVLSAYQKIQ